MGACPRGAGKLAQPGEHVWYDKERRVARKLFATVGGDDRDCVFGERRRYELMTVAVVALNGEERLTRRDGPRIDGNSGNGLRQRALALGPHGVRHCVDGPQ